mmetsp:Transcript_35532/g.49326  ORF Transcript_35532/g.49326 Transcript_35532/m.49326 type:complete len:168 (-) Transcript_35532:244-747(-)
MNSGELLVGQLLAWGLSPGDLPTVHSSPYLRTMQTAANIAKLTQSTVQPVRGLGHCVAELNALKQGRVLPLLASSALKQKCASSVPLRCRDDTKGGILSTITRLAQQALKEEKKVLVIVTHRETFTEILGEKMRPPYGGGIVLDFRINFETKNSQWKLLQRDYRNLN